MKKVLLSVAVLFTAATMALACGEEGKKACCKKGKDAKACAGKDEKSCSKKKACCKAKHADGAENKAEAPMTPAPAQK